MVQPLPKMSELGFSQGSAVDENALLANGASMVNFGGHEQTVVIFYYESVLDQTESRRQGRPIRTREVFCKSYQPGEERLQENVRPATDDLKRRYPRQWAAFEQNRAYVPDGTPIDYLFPANPEIPAMLRYHGFHTCELLAKATPLAIESIGMGMQDWISKAKRYLEDSKKGVDHHALKELEERHARELKVLQNQIADLVSRLNTAATLANNTPTGVRLAPELPLERLAPLTFTERATPPTEFIDEDPEPDEPNPTPKRGGWPKGKPRK